MSDQKRERPGRGDVRPMFKRAESAGPAERPVMDASKPHKIPGTLFAVLAGLSGALGLMFLFGAVAGGELATLIVAFGLLLIAGIMAVASHTQRAAFELALM